MMHILISEGLEIRRNIVLLVAAIILIQPLIPQGEKMSAPVREMPYMQSQYTEQDLIIITSNEEFTDYGFSGTGTEIDPYVLSNVVINSTQTAVSIYSTSAHFIMQDFIVQAGSIGIRLDNVSNGVIEDCEIRASTAGISLSGESIIVRNCDISLADTGVWAESLNFGVIEHCTLHHNVQGITYNQGNDSQISYCTYYANTGHGLELSSDASNITVFQNNFGWNGNGISAESLIVSNARDVGVNNTWIANRWSDFTALPYVINGGFSRDLSASLLVDITLPIVTSPDDLRYDEGETGNWLAWNATDEYSADFSLMLDGVQILDDAWLGETYNISVDGLYLGSHNFTIRFVDAAGNSVSDEVWVSVMISIFGGEGTELILYASIASIGSVIVLIILIKRMR
ncbi:MAG: right-handed parallel beta-helix repeat-containing protein [Candidatus Thorarchaeota archaeon]|nr:right-handed parallel beta-helix repeat-containing protein [Candidatus Thorarchaeota archaeon]